MNLLILIIVGIIIGAILWAGVFPKSLPYGQGYMRFGPNRIVWEIRRAKRDASGEPLRDAEGNILYHDEVEVLESHNITCNAGKDAAKDREFNSATSKTVAQFIALSCDASTPAATWTAIPAEITTGGLQRAAGTYSVSGCGVGECILSKVFTATATHTNVQLMGLLNLAANGDLYFAATITPATLISGDQLTAKWDKITLS